jgi:hypothetical protein
MSAISRQAKLQPRQSQPTAIPPDKSVLITTTYALAPGAPLTRGVYGYDDLIVALSDGSLRNEAKTDGQPFSVAATQTFLMPRGEAYRLRNVGDKELRVLVIELRKR